MAVKRYTLWIALLALALLVAAPLAVQAKRREGVGRPTVTVVPPIPLVPGATPTAVDPRALRFEPAEIAGAGWMGNVTVLTNRTGFHLWFRPASSHENYVVGRWYHAAFKVRARCSAGWTAISMPTTGVPVRFSRFVGQDLCYRVSGPRAVSGEAMAR
jgi:hypothetical protein